MRSHKQYTVCCCRILEDSVSERLHNGAQSAAIHDTPQCYGVEHSAGHTSSTGINSMQVSEIRPDEVPERGTAVLLGFAAVGFAARCRRSSITFQERPRAGTALPFARRSGLLMKKGISSSADSNVRDGLSSLQRVVFLLRC